MASRKLASASTRLLQSSSSAVARGDPLMQCLLPPLSRSMATEVSRTEAIAEEIASTFPPNDSVAAMNFPLRRSPPPVRTVLTTVHSFPTMEPLRFEHYPVNHLYLPLRKDILHRAVIFEGDNTRQGTASTKWRSEVRGSGRKIRPQKGTGQARLGDKKSPMLVGGGVAFGPKPRDFSTKLPKKVYDLAWRTALSYRYRRGQLLVVEDGDLDLETPSFKLLRKIMDSNKIGGSDGKSLLITTSERPNLWEAFEHVGKYGKLKTEDEVDVKNLLELGKIVIEKSALDNIIAAHSSDLERMLPSAVY